MAPKNQSRGGSSGSSISSNAQRWLATLKYAEGTQDKSYSTAFSGKQYDNNKPHPGTVYTSKSGRSSAAHGAYQFMPDTWKDIHGGKNPPMTKENQDKAALWLMKNRAGIDPDKTPITKESVSKLAGTWASFPNAEGKSAYNQPVKNYKELEKIWKESGDNNNTNLKINTKDQQGHFNPNSVGKMGPTFQPNSSVSTPVISARPGVNSPSRAADFLDKPDFLDTNKGYQTANSMKIGGLPGLNDIAQAGIANYGHFKNRSNSYGQSAFSKPSSTWSNINNRSYGGSMNLGRTLGITSSPSYRAVTNSGYNWGSTAGASNSWRTGYGI